DATRRLRVAAGQLEGARVAAQHGDVVAAVAVPVPGHRQDLGAPGGGPGGRQRRAVVVDPGDDAVGLAVDAHRVVAAAVPVAHDRERVVAAGLTARDRRGGPAPADQHDERRVGPAVEADGVTAVAVEVAGHRPDVGAPGLAEGDGLDGPALVV